MATSKVTALSPAGNVTTGTRGNTELSSSLEGACDGSNLEELRRTCSIVDRGSIFSHGVSGKEEKETSLRTHAFPEMLTEVSAIQQT